MWCHLINQKSIHLPTTWKQNLCPLIILSGWMLKHFLIFSRVMSFVVSQMGLRGTKERKLPLAHGIWKQSENAVVGNAFSTDGYTNKKLFMQNWCTTTFWKRPVTPYFCILLNLVAPPSPLSSQSLSGIILWCFVLSGDDQF